MEIYYYIKFRYRYVEKQECALTKRWFAQYLEKDSLLNIFGIETSALGNVVCDHRCPGIYARYIVSTAKASKKILRAYLQKFAHAEEKVLDHITTFAYGV